jgi:hypothetical protein
MHRNDLTKAKSRGKFGKRNVKLYFYLYIKILFHFSINENININYNGERKKEEIVDFLDRINSYEKLTKIKH